MTPSADDLLACIESQYALTSPGLARRLGTKGRRLAFELTAGEGRYVVKLTEPHRTDAEASVRQDTLVLDHLAAHQFPSPRLLRAMAGDRFVPFQDRFLYIYHFVDGIEPRPDRDFFLRLGELLARLHTLPIDDELGQSTFLPDRELPYLRHRLVGVRDPARLPLATMFTREIDGLPSLLDLPQALIHTDLSYGNLVVAPDGTLHLLDFDDAGLAPALIDVGYTLAHLCTLTAQDRRRWHVPGPPDGMVARPDWAAAFLHAYQQIRPLHADERRLLPAAAAFGLLSDIWDWERNELYAASGERYRLMQQMLADPGLSLSDSD